MPPFEGAGRCVGSVVGCRKIVEPRPAPECAFRAPGASGAAGRWASASALLATLGLGLLRLRHRARRWRTSVATPLMRAPEVGQERKRHTLAGPDDESSSGGAIRVVP